MASNKETVLGEVIECLPNLEFKVQLEDRVLRCYTGGKMKLNKIKVLIGDKVEVVDAGNIGRIVRRR